MADHPAVRNLMKDKPDRTGGAGEGGMARSAHQGGNVASPVEENDRLLTAVKGCGNALRDRVGQGRGPGAGRDEVDGGERSSADSSGKTQAVVAAR